MANHNSKSYVGEVMAPSSQDSYSGCSFTGVVFSGGSLQLLGGCSLVRCGGELDGLMMTTTGGLPPNTVDNSVVRVKGTALLDGIRLEASGLSVVGEVLSDTTLATSDTGSLVEGDGSWLRHIGAGGYGVTELVSVLPAEVSLSKGGAPKQLSVVFDDGFNVPDRCSWSSSDPAVATVDSSGRVSSVGSGSCVITAEHNGKSLSVHLIVKTTVYFSSNFRSYDLKTWELLDSRAAGVKSYAGGVLFCSSSNSGPMYYSLDMGTTWATLTIENDEYARVGYAYNLKEKLSGYQASYVNGVWVCPSAKEYIDGGAMVSKDLKKWYHLPVPVLGYSSNLCLSVTTASDTLIGASVDWSAGRAMYKVQGIPSAPVASHLIGTAYKVSGVEDHEDYVPVIVRSGDTYLVDNQGCYSSESGEDIFSSVDGGVSWSSRKAPVHNFVLPIRDDYWVAIGAYTGKFGSSGAMSPSDPGAIRISRDKGATWIAPSSFIIDVGLTGAYADPRSYLAKIDNYYPYAGGDGGSGPKYVKTSGSWYLVVRGLTAGVEDPWDYSLYKATGDVLMRVDVDPVEDSVRLVLEPGISTGSSTLLNLFAVEEDPVADMEGFGTPPFSSYSGEVFIAVSLRTYYGQSGYFTYDALKVSYDRGKTWDVTVLGNESTGSARSIYPGSTSSSKRVSTSTHQGCVAVHNGAIVVGGTLGRIYVIRPDGTREYARASSDAYSIAVSDKGECVLTSTATSGGVATAMVSKENLSSWSELQMPGSSFSWRVAYGNGKFVGVGGKSSIVSSDGGATWVTHSQSASVADSLTVNSPSDCYFGDIAFGNGVFVATCQSDNGYGGLMRSVDGISWFWSFHYRMLQNGATSVAFDGVYFRTICLAGPGYSVRSPDGVLWDGDESMGQTSTSRFGALPGTSIFVAGDGGVEALRYDNKDEILRDAAYLPGLARPGDQASVYTSGGFAASDFSWLPAGSKVPMNTTFVIDSTALMGAGSSIQINGLDPTVEHEINWGDGTTTVGSGSSELHTVVAVGGPYLMVSLQRGRFMDNLTGTSIVQPTNILRGATCWGRGFTGVKSMAGIFEGHTGLMFIPDTWRGLESLEDASNMFKGASLLNCGGLGGFSGLYKVKKADGMFSGCSGFRGDVGGLHTVLRGSGASHASAFFGCAGATGYSSIPSDWKS